MLDILVLYLSRYIVRNKSDYYRLLQAVREQADAPEVWQEWVLYVLAAVEVTAQQIIVIVTDISAAWIDYKHRICAAFKFYRQNLINSLFMSPYTKIKFVERDSEVSRLTATKYLDGLMDAGFVRKVKMVKVGRSNYYINVRLNEILTR